MTKARNIRQLVAAALGLLLAFLCGVWGALALWYQVPGGPLWRWLASVAWVIVVFVLATASIVLQRWWPIGVYALLFAALRVWWASIEPSNDQPWCDDVARTLSGTAEGSRVTLHNVRDFRWRSNTEYAVRWETRHYDLDNLQSADAVVSHWGLPGIAHAMISFGFSDGQHVVFSVEIRKQRGQKYSAIGGFFKQFHTILVAADERDIIRVRTNVRGEDDYLYRLTIDRATRRSLFVSYVATANRLAEHPEFYNSFSSNCTTMVYRMAREIDPGLAWDPRLLLTGFLDGYLRRVGAVDRRVSRDALRRDGRITERARRSGPSDDFSRIIREGMHESRQDSVVAP